VLGWYWVFGWLLISGTVRPVYPLPDSRLVRAVHQPVHAGLGHHDRGRRAEVLHPAREAAGSSPTACTASIRHPNYLGEMMIYGSFALMVWHWLPVVVLVWVWLGLFAVNMVLKEASMSRYPEWAAYKKRTWWLVPGLL
jgi:hypothetical protein